MSEPDGMLKGWNSSVRTTTAMSSAWMTTFTVSRKPPSLSRGFAVTLILLSTRA